MSALAGGAAEAACAGDRGKATGEVSAVHAGRRATSGRNRLTNLSVSSGARAGSGHARLFSRLAADPAISTSRKPAWKEGFSGRCRGVRALACSSGSDGAAASRTRRRPCRPPAAPSRDPGRPGTEFSRGRRVIRRRRLFPPDVTTITPADENDLQVSEPADERDGDLRGLDRLVTPAAESALLRPPRPYPPDRPPWIQPSTRRSSRAGASSWAHRARRR
jgi:hypothetical protein